MDSYGFTVLYMICLSLVTWIFFKRFPTAAIQFGDPPRCGALFAAFSEPIGLLIIQLCLGPSRFAHHGYVVCNQGRQFKHAKLGNYEWRNGVNMSCHAFRWGTGLMVREETSRYDPSESDVWLLLMQNCDLNVMLYPLWGGASSLPLGSSILF